jgi:hypothetical protein
MYLKLGWQYNTVQILSILSSSALPACPRPTLCQLFADERHNACPSRRAHRPQVDRRASLIFLGSYNLCPSQTHSRDPTALQLSVRHLSDFTIFVM